ncbi:hypothetical protein CPC16_002056 [Podila verticillata]|nr:hypothetical protein CPC16_002056 [Podila verticillata]
MFPKTLALLSVLTLVVAIQAQDEVPQVLTVGELTAPLIKRACIYDECKCNKSDKDGKACHGSNIYQCNANGECCNYGFSKSCDRCGSTKPCKN